MPEEMRASITSSTPSLNVVHWRGKPGLVGLVARIVTPGLSPNSNDSIVAIALLLVECPERYSGCGAVGNSGVHAGSPTVSSFPSRWPLRIAAWGRQKLKTYLASQHAIDASAAARYMSANTCAVSEVSRPRASMTRRATPFQMAEGVPSQNRPISVCSAVRVVLERLPSSLTSL